MTLSAKHKMFADEYLKDLNATAAYKRAGYIATGNSAEVSAAKLLRHPKVAAYIQERMNKRAQKLELDAEYVLKNLIEIGERCMQKVPVMYYDKQDKLMRQETAMVLDPVTGETSEEGVWEFDSSGALRAQELLGKHLKLFTDKTELTGKDGAALLPTINVRFVKPGE